MEKKHMIEEQVEQVREFLLGQGYAPRTIIVFYRCWQSLIDYARENSYEYYTKHLGKEFLLSKCGEKDVKLFSRKEKFLVRSIRLLETFLQSSNVAAYQLRNPLLPAEYRDIYDQYVNHLINLGQQPKSLKTKKSRLRPFIFFYLITR